MRVGGRRLDFEGFWGAEWRSRFVIISDTRALDANAKFLQHATGPLCLHSLVVGLSC